MDNESLLGWVLAGVGVVVATLSAAVATLWKTSETRNAKAIEALQVIVDECQRQKMQFIREIAELEGRIKELEKHVARLEAN